MEVVVFLCVSLPSARALAVSAGAGVPDRLVRHLERLMEFFLAKKGKFRRGVGLA